MKLYPQPGMLIPDLAKGDALPAEGRDVEMSTYWRRRLRDGDVTDVAPTALSVTGESTESPVDDSAGDQNAAESAAPSTHEGE